MPKSSLIKSLFGKTDSASALWNQFAEKHSGICKIHFGDYLVIVPYKQFQIQISAYTHYIVVGGGTYESYYLRAQLNFVPKTNFQLQITEEDWVDAIGKLFGMQDIEIRNDAFDQKYRIKSNDEPITRHFLSQPGLATSIIDGNPLRIELTKEDGLFGELPEKDCHMIYLIGKVEVNNIQQLEGCLSLMKNLTDAAITSGLI